MSRVKLCSVNLSLPRVKVLARQVNAGHIAFITLTIWDIFLFVFRAVYLGKSHTGRGEKHRSYTAPSGQLVEQLTAHPSLTLDQHCHLQAVSGHCHLDAQAQPRFSHQIEKKCFLVSFAVLNVLESISTPHFNYEMQLFD